MAKNDQMCFTPVKLGFLLIYGFIVILYIMDAVKARIKLITSKDLS